MKKRILKLGRVKLVIIISMAAVILAISIDSLITNVLGQSINFPECFSKTGLIALFVSPIVSWYPTGMLFEIDTLEKKMAVLASYDDLTGVFNRRAFYKTCDGLHQSAMRSEKQYCLLLIDLDYFKKINDQYGHGAGDMVLTAFGEASGLLSRDDDVVGRLGGEEFAFFLPDTNMLQAEEFSQRLLNKIKRIVVVYDANTIKFTASIGICLNPCDDEVSFNDVLKNADKALYSAKNNGRNQVFIFTKESDMSD